MRNRVFATLPWIATLAIVACGESAGSRGGDEDPDVALIDTGSSETGADTGVDPGPDVAEVPDSAANDSSAPDVASVDGGDPDVDRDDPSAQDSFFDAPPDDSPDAADLSDPDAGPPICTADRDCAGGQICVDGGCVDLCRDAMECPDELPVCDPDLRVCVACAETSDCGEVERCVESECVPWCWSDFDCLAGFACDPDTGRCTEVVPCELDSDCRGGEVCRVGECIDLEDIVCAPAAVECHGDALATCNAQGTGWTEAICDETAACDGAFFGCRCDGAACVERACEPGSVSCFGNAVGTCLDDGSDWSPPADCLPDESCRGGVCELNLVCSPGERVCAGDTLRICNTRGTGWTDDNCATRGEICAFADGSAGCEPRPCTPNARTCVGEALHVCNATGTSLTVTDCAASGLLCTGTGGATNCTAPVCTAGATTCADNNTRRICDARGASYTDQDCGWFDTCVGGVCGSFVCSPSDPVECVDGDVKRCNSGGTGWVTIEDCGSMPCSETGGAHCETVPIGGEFGGCYGAPDCPDGFDCVRHTPGSPIGTCLDTCSWIDFCGDPPGFEASCDIDSNGDGGDEHCAIVCDAPSDCPVGMRCINFGGGYSCLWP